MHSDNLFIKDNNIVTIWKPPSDDDLFIIEEIIKCLDYYTINVCSYATR